MAILRLPALIDPHVHMVSGHPSDWLEVATMAKRAGYAALQIMPDLDPPITDKLTLAYYEKLTKDLPTKLLMTAVATDQNSEDIKQLRSVSAIKLWLGTGPEDLVVTKEEQLRQVLLSTDKIVMIHAEDEFTLIRNFSNLRAPLSLEHHGQIFDRVAAVRATIKAITASRETGRRIYLCHVSTGEELELIRAAKAKGIRVFAEAAPHHLFLDENDLDRLGTHGKVNPPLRPREDRLALWDAIEDGTIDTIGSDTAAWYYKEKDTDYDMVPSGFANLELTLPLLLTAMTKKLISYERIIELTSTNPARIFGITKPNWSIYADMDRPRSVILKLSDWHPYDFEQLIGWPVLSRETPITASS